MYIKEVSKLYNIREETLRYYEKAGIIPKVRRNESGIRDYSEQDLGWVENAICMRKAGMTVHAIAEYVELTKPGDQTLEKRLALLMEQREKLIEEQERMNTMIDRISYKIRHFQEKIEAANNPD